ncbi:M16 family metallopeptidase [Cnuella takakiae]|nr:pitrilysin family protein [Cnuella takakiae]OLY94828.1 peptidase M16 [Cnuella takakiae]
MKKLLFCITLLACFIAQSQQAAFKLPPYQKFQLPNGLTVYLMEQKEVPLVSVSAIFPAGAIYDAQKSGLASLTASALMHGTRTMSKQVLDSTIDYLGAEVNTYAGKESAGLSARFARKDAATVLGLIRDIVLSPRFDTAEFRKEQQRTLVQLEQAKESPRQVIGNYFDQVMFAGHVYANPASGNKASVAALSAKDVAAFYKAQYLPNGSAIAVAGDFDSREMKKLLADLFGKWTKGNLPANLANQPINAPASAKVLLVNKDDARETTFYIGAPGVSRSNPDLVAIDVINTILGGRFTSWLNDELRVNSGLTYGANSGFSSLKNGGSFRISTFTATKNTAAAIDKALEVMQRLHTQGVDENTLASAKNYVKGQFPPRYETSGQLAGLLTQMYWYGFDESYINNFQKQVDGLTTARAKEIIQRYFPKDKLQFVLVGKASEIRELAKKWGPVTEVNIKEEQAKSF